jgi:hypothetical protein
MSSFYLGLIPVGYSHAFLFLKFRLTACHETRNFQNGMHRKKVTGTTFRPKVQGFTRQLFKGRYMSANYFKFRSKITSGRYKQSNVNNKINLNQIILKKTDFHLKNICYCIAGCLSECYSIWATVTVDFVWLVLLPPHYWTMEFANHGLKRFLKSAE